MWRKSSLEMDWQKKRQSKLRHLGPGTFNVTRDQFGVRFLTKEGFRVRKEALGRRRRRLFHITHSSKDVKSECCSRVRRDTAPRKVLVGTQSSLCVYCSRHRSCAPPIIDLSAQRSKGPSTVSAHLPSMPVRCRSRTSPARRQDLSSTVHSSSITTRSFMASLKASAAWPGAADCGGSTASSAVGGGRDGGGGGGGGGTSIAHALNKDGRDNGQCVLVHLDHLVLNTF